MKKYTQADVLGFLKGRTVTATQAGLARELGFTPQFISDVLAGRRVITRKLAEALGFRKLPDAYVKER